MYRKDVYCGHVCNSRTGHTKKCPTMADDNK